MRYTFEEIVRDYPGVQDHRRMIQNSQLERAFSSPVSKSPTKLAFESDLRSKIASAIKQRFGSDAKADEKSSPIRVTSTDLSSLRQHDFSSALGVKPNRQPPQSQ